MKQGERGWGRLFTSVAPVGLAALATLAYGAVAMGCGGAPERAAMEDRARRLAPVPACFMPLPARPSSSATAVRALREEQYWKLVFPAYDEDKHALPAESADCRGGAALRDPSLAGGAASRGWPLAVEEGDVVIGAGGDRLRIVWLRSHVFENGDAGGVLALVRTVDDAAEVYALGVYRGRRDKSRFALERMGSDVVVTAEDDGCTGGPAGQPCETILTVFGPRQGSLLPLAKVALERVAFARNGEPGSRGTTAFHLTSAPSYEVDGMHVFEQVSVTDESGRELRRAELTRLYAPAKGKLAPDEDPLWPRIFPVAAR